MGRKGTLPLVGLLLATGCVADPSQSSEGVGTLQQGVVVTGDERERLEDLALYDSVGTLYLAESMCTAFFTDRDEIMTSRHCLKTVRDYSEITFVAGNGDRYAVPGMREELGSADLVRLRVEGLDREARGVPLRVGRLAADQDATLVAFDPEFAEFVVAPGDAPTALGPYGVLMHDLDTIPGASGSPILQNGKVVAVHVGSLHPEDDSAEEIDTATLGDAEPDDRSTNVAVDINARHSAELSRVEGHLCLEAWGWGHGGGWGGGSGSWRGGHGWGYRSSWGHGGGSYRGGYWGGYRGWRGGHGHSTYRWGGHGGRRWSYGGRGHYRHGGRGWGHYGSRRWRW